MIAPPEISQIIWGFSTIGCVEASWLDVVKLARRFKLQTIELRGLHGSLDLVSVLNQFPGGVIQLAVLLKENGIRIPVLATGFQLSSNDVLARENLLKIAASAEEIGCPWLRVFGGKGGLGPPQTGEWDVIQETLDWWEATRSNQSWSVDLLLETHDIFSTSQSCIQLAESRDLKINILWDIQHTCGTCEEPPELVWRNIGKWVRHVHVSDRSQLGPYFNIVLPGLGKLPVIETLAILRRDCFAGVVSLEWERLWHPEIPSLEEALEAACLSWDLEKADSNQ